MMTSLVTFVFITAWAAIGCLIALWISENI